MILCEGDFVAARTTMAGVFSAPMEVPPFGRMNPNGRLVTRELNNIFRYDRAGRLPEEWVQYDNLSYSSAWARAGPGRIEGAVRP